jgi:UDP-N-acetylmuramoyl-tripeptide--D-alanyl-D-alanine ligase
MKWLLSQVAEATQGRLIGRDVDVTGVSTDTRTVADGQIFIALSGERFDAHDFLDQAIAAGATALLVSDESRVPAGCSAVVVDDTRLALGRLAAAWRARFSLPVIAVTGSNGKTTTKEMIASILKAAFGAAVLSTRGNLNNDIGLPLTLLGLRSAHRAAVIEMGMNHPGEIAYLAKIGAPTVALVTNAQRAHLEGMGDLEEVAREKGSIFAGLLPNGVAIINADDAYADCWRSMVGAHAVRTFGIDQVADVRAAVRQHGLEIAIELTAPEGQAAITLHIPGRHNARNAVAAAAACLAAGVKMADVAAGLEAFSGSRGVCSVVLATRAQKFSTIPTTPIRIRFEPVSTCWPRRLAASCWSWATWAKSARPAASFTTKSVAMPRARGLIACLRLVMPPSKRCATLAKAPSITAILKS